MEPEFYFSPSTNSFFIASMLPDYVNAGTLPEDVEPVDSDVAREFMGIPPEGKMRVVIDGLPAWGDIPPPTQEELIAEADSEKQRLIDEANAYMNSKQWPGKAAIGRLKGGELAQYNLWLDYLDALEATDASSTPDIDWPAMPGR